MTKVVINRVTTPAFSKVELLLNSCEDLQYLTEISGTEFTFSKDAMTIRRSPYLTLSWLQKISSRVKQLHLHLSDDGVAALEAGEVVSFENVTHVELRGKRITADLVKRILPSIGKIREVTLGEGTIALCTLFQCRELVVDVECRLAPAPGGYMSATQHAHDDDDDEQEEEGGSEDDEEEQEDEEEEGGSDDDEDAAEAGSDSVY